MTDTALSAVDEAFLAAVRKGDVSAAAKALDAGADINIETKSNNAALVQAVKQSNMPLATMLCQRGASMREDAPFSPLYEAIRRKHVPMVRLLLQHTEDINHLSAGNKSPLHLAATLCHTEITRMLLDYGASMELMGEGVIGKANAYDMAEDTLSMNGGLGASGDKGRQRACVDVLRKQTEAYEMPLPATYDIKTLAFEGEGYAAPLDQPRLWHQFDDVVRQMEKQGQALGKADLLAMNTDGKSWLQRGVECGKGTEVLAYLSARNEPLEPQDMLGADGLPTPLLQAIADHYALPALFSHDQWKGRPPEAMQQVYQALPEDARGQVNNYHSLLIRLQRDEQVLSISKGR